MCPQGASEHSQNTVLPLSWASHCCSADAIVEAIQACDSTDYEERTYYCINATLPLSMIRLAVYVANTALNNQLVVHELDYRTRLDRQLLPVLLNTPACATGDCHTSDQ
jgi:hypothetical protein